MTRGELVIFSYLHFNNTIYRKWHGIVCILKLSSLTSPHLLPQLPIPPEGEELTLQRDFRKAQDEDIMACRGIITSGAGIEPIIVDICDKNELDRWSGRVIEDMLKDVTTNIERTSCQLGLQLYIVRHSS